MARFLSNGHDLVPQLLLITMGTVALRTVHLHVCTDPFVCHMVFYECFYLDAAASSSISKRRSSLQTSPARMITGSAGIL